MKFFNQIPFVSLLVTGWNFGLNGYKNKSPHYRRKQQWKIVMYVLCFPRFTHNWFGFLKSPGFEDVFAHRSRLYIKPFRPYISIKWNKKQKVKVILDTYQFIKSKVDVLGQILTDDGGKIIAKLKLDNEHEGLLKLGYDDRFRKEGELVLWLECGQLGGKVVSAAFSFEETPKGDWITLIGCVQGNNNVHNEKSFKLMQKLMHGLRPNAFIIHMLQEFSRYLGCTGILATGDSIQAYRKKHAIHLPWAHTINFNYDQFWREIGGKDLEGGWFDLPLIPANRKNIEEIQSKKRSMYRKRYCLLDELSDQICDSLVVIDNSFDAEPRQIAEI